jgi:phage/plasmid-like protein (TIGR03299 family)
MSESTIVIESVDPDGVYSPEETGTAVLTMVPDLSPADDDVVEPAAIVPAPRQLPWAGITTGQAGGDLLTSQQMLERAGLNWEVGIRPLWRQLSDGEFSQSKMLETYRADTEDQLGTVRSRYELLQNREAFDFGDSLVDAGTARWAEAGQQFGGVRIFMTLLLEDEFMVLGQEPFKMYMFFSTSHDGTRSLTASLTPIRGFCLNQTNVIRANNFGRFTIQHTGSMKGKLEQAADSIRLAGSYSELLKAEAEKLASIKITDDKARYLITSLIPQRRARRDDMIDGIVANYLTSPTAGDSGTGWRLLNGLTEYMDHIKPTRSGNARFEAITTGEGHQYRTRLVTALAELN